MSFQDNFYVSLLEYLHARGVDADKVTGFSEESRAGGYCETCYYEYTEVEIQYELNGESITFDYYGDMAELIRELT